MINDLNLTFNEISKLDDTIKSVVKVLDCSIPHKTGIKDSGFKNLDGYNVKYSNNDNHTIVEIQFDSYGMTAMQLSKLFMNLKDALQYPSGFKCSDFWVDTKMYYTGASTDDFNVSLVPVYE